MKKPFKTKNMSREIILASLLIDLDTEHKTSTLYHMKIAL